jgi:hypothetical protein
LITAVRTLLDQEKARHPPEVLGKRSASMASIASKTSLASVASSNASDTTKHVRTMMAGVAQIAGKTPGASKEQVKKASQRVLDAFSRTFFE